MATKPKFCQCSPYSNLGLLCARCAGFGDAALLHDLRIPLSWTGPFPASQLIISYEVLSSLKLADDYTIWHMYIELPSGVIKHALLEHSPELVWCFSLHTLGVLHGEAKDSSFCDPKNRVILIGRMNLLSSKFLVWHWLQVIPPFLLNMYKSFYYFISGHLPLVSPFLLVKNSNHFQNHFYFLGQKKH